MNTKKTVPPPQKTPVVTKSNIKQQPKPVPKAFRAQDYVSSTVTLEEVLGVKQAFDIFDADKTGLVDPVELKNAFTSLGFAGQNKFVLRILGDYEHEKPDGINFGQFLKLSTSKLGDTGSRAEVERVFNSFDINRAGKISALDMKRIAQQLNQNLTEQQIDKMVAKADSDEDGYLSVEDFYVVLSKMSGQDYEQ